MEIKLVPLKLFEIEQMRILNQKDSLEKWNSKATTMNQSDLQRVYIYAIYLRDSKISSDKGFLIIDYRIKGGTHWN